MGNIQYLVKTPHSFFVREEFSRGDKDVIREVIDQDCYQLNALYYSGFQPKVIFDVGAHIGSFTVLAHSLFGEGKYFCFEPNPVSADLCKLNCPFATVIPRAVYYKDNRDLVYVDGKGATGGGFVAEEKNVEFLSYRKHQHDHWNYYISQSTVPTVTLEEIYHEHNIDQIDLLKMDCEGGEWEIAESLDKDIASCVKMIKGEYHTFNGKHVEAFKNLMTSKFPHLEFEFGLEKNHGLFYSKKK